MSSLKWHQSDFERTYDSDELSQRRVSHGKEEAYRSSSSASNLSSTSDESVDTDVTLSDTSSDESAAERKIQRESRNLTEFEKGMVHAMVTYANMSWSSIGRVINKDRRGLQRWHTKYLATKDYTTKKCGKPKTTQRQDRYIVRTVRRDNRFDSNDTIRAQLKAHVDIDISHSTLHRRLREVGVRSRVERTGVLVSDINRKKRVEWCKKLLKLTTREWARILWADESYFNPLGCGKGRVWRTKDEKNDPTLARPVSKWGKGSIGVFGCFSS